MIGDKNVGFDSLLDFPITLYDSVGVSPNGNLIVTSKYNKGTFLEHSNTSNLSPISILPEEADNIGFFGRNTELIALSVKNKLIVIDSYRMDIFAEKDIRPGSLYVPASGKSSRIGFVDSSGQSCVMTEDRKVERSSLYVGNNEKYHVLWSNTVTPVGYHSIEDDTVNLYIRSKKEDKGSTISSTWGIYTHCIWWNPHLKRHEAYITTLDNKNTVQRITSSDGSPVIDEVCDLGKETTVTGVITLSDGQPILVTGRRGTEVVSEEIPPETNTAAMLKDVLTFDHDKQEISLIGNNIYTCWRQNPASAPKLEVVNFGISGHPTYAVKGNEPNNYADPAINQVITIKTKDKQNINYRLVSPFNPKKHLMQSIIIMADHDGYISSGEFSPTVKMCYDSGIAVAIVPTRELKKRQFTLNDYKLDLIDVSYDIKKKNIAKKVISMGNNQYSLVALESMQDRRSSITDCILIDPSETTLGKVKKRKRKHVSIVSTTEDYNDNGFFVYHMPQRDDVDYYDDIASIINGNEG